MEEERKQRCFDKIELAERRILKISEILNKFDDETFKLACYKAFQEVIEAITDIIAMILIDRKKSVGDDYSNIEKIKEIILLNEEEIAVLKEANGLRNRVIHEYNKTDDKKAKESISTLLPKIEEITNKIGKFVEKND